MPRDPKSVSFSELETFILVTKVRSIRSAARELDLLPSHVSKIIARLEAKLGCKLIERNSSGVTVSREGLGIVGIANSVLEGGKPLFRDIKDAAHNAAQLPVLTIGSFSYVNQLVLPSALRKMPDILASRRLRILDLPPTGFSSAATKNVFDFVIHTRQEIWPKSWDVALLGKMKWGLFSRVNHPLGRSPKSEEVLRYPFVVPTYWQGDEYSAGDDLFPIPWSRRIKGHEASTAFSAMQLVGQSNHLTYVPRIIVQSFAASDSVQEISSPDFEPVERELFLMTKVDQVGSKEKRSFANGVGQALRFLQESP